MVLTVTTGLAARPSYLFVSIPSSLAGVLVVITFSLLIQSIQADAPAIILGMPSLSLIGAIKA